MAKGKGKKWARAMGKGKGKGGSREFQISKALSEVLRHKASEWGLQISPDGFVAAEALLGISKFTDLHCTEGDLKRITGSSDKKRFEIKEEVGGLFIRAVQGHSIRQVHDDQCLERLTLNDPSLPTICVHGTYWRYSTRLKNHPRGKVH